MKFHKRMSRVGKKAIPVPNDVTVIVNGNVVKVQGPKGILEQTFNSIVSFAVEDGENGKEIVVRIENEGDRSLCAQWGTARSILANLVEGVTKGFSKKLEINGVGYRVKVEGRNVVLTVGYSHDVSFALPDGVQAEVDGNTITLSGPDKQLVGEVAANIRKIRKPEPYKGKGIKYVDEVIRRKAGKAQKAGD